VLIFKPFKPLEPLGQWQNNHLKCECFSAINHPPAAITDTDAIDAAGESRGTAPALRYPKRDDSPKGLLLLIFHSAPGTLRRALRGTD
jgi:hypothetical protein